MILITVCDFDPEGEVIAQSFVESIRNDFFPDLDADRVVGVKAALRLDQIQDLDLPSSEGLDPKPDSKQLRKWLDKYGPDQKTYELEAIEAATLIELVETTLRPFIDFATFDKQVKAEKREARELNGVREALRKQLADYVNGSNGHN